METEGKEIFPQVREILTDEFLFAVKVDQPIEIKIQRCSDRSDICPDNDEQKKTASHANFVIHLRTNEKIINDVFRRSNTSFTCSNRTPEKRFIPRCIERRDERQRVNR